MCFRSSSSRNFCVHTSESRRSCGRSQIKHFSKRKQKRQEKQLNLYELLGDFFCGRSRSSVSVDERTRTENNETPSRTEVGTKTNIRHGAHRLSTKVYAFARLLAASVYFRLLDPTTKTFLIQLMLSQLNFHCTTFDK